MAKRVELKERGTGEVLYPVTTPSSILVGKGKDMSLFLEGKEGQILRSLDGIPEWSNFISFYALDFIKGNVIQEYNVNKEFLIKDINMINVEDVTLHIDTGLVETIVGTVVPTGSLLSWEISKTNEELPAAIGITIEYNDNRVI